MPESGNAPLTSDEIHDEIRKIVEDWNEKLLSDKEAINQIASMFGFVGERD